MAEYIVEDVKFRWNLTPEDIAKRTDEVIEQSRKVYEKVGALKPEEVTFENCLQVQNEELLRVQSRNKKKSYGKY
jgi:hypothetical protein